MSSRLTARWLEVNASVVAIGIVALAFLLRAWRLADKNVWWDEGWTVWLSQKDFLAIALRTASDEHPPLHYWLMHIWQGVVGTGAPALALAQGQAYSGRFFSLFFGVLSVALLYRIGKRIGGPALGLLAALLLTLARFQVWWSQDIKNYTLAGFFALASVWFVLDFRFQKPESGFKSASALGYILSITLALYSHYLAALILLANNLFFAIVLLSELRAGRRPAKMFLQWCALQIAVLALFAPWLVLYLQNGATWTAAPTFDFGLFLKLAATVFALGVTTYIENYTFVVIALSALVLVGAGWVIRRRRKEDRRPSWGAVYALVIVLIPPVLLYMLSLTPAAIFAPKIQARYLLILLPAYSLLLALGMLFLAGLSKYLALAAFVLIAAAQAYALNDYYEERVLHDEYFTLAQMINNFGRPGDGLVLNTDQEWPTFLYYLNQPRDWVGVPNGAAVDESAAQRVAAQTQPYQAVWLVTIPDALQKDPRHLIEAELARKMPKQYEQTFGDKRLTLYAPTVRNVKDAPRETFSPQQARDDAIDDRIKLVGVDLPVREAQPGDVVRLVTYWASQDFVDVQTQLQTRAGTVVAQQTTPVSIGAHERAQADLVIPPDALADELRVVVRARLKGLPIGNLQIIPRQASSDAGTPTESLAYRFGDHIQLVGMSLPMRTAGAGAALPLTLFWKTDQPPDTEYKVFVHLLGAQYNPAQDNFLWGQVDSIPAQGKLPTTAWPANRVIADAYSIPIDPNAPRGTYQIEVGLYRVATGIRLRAFDANGKEIGDAVIMTQVEVGN